MNQGVKTNLAKLLATENLIVEHANVETASFDVVNRVLTLPTWEASENVYDMLVGHEVGHALFTPNELVDSDLPLSYINVVEDARIERMIKNTYPGLIKSFASGYKELIKADFFEVEGKDLNTFNLIDRINLYFKIGIADVSVIIPFTDEEQKFVEMTRNTTTFEEVCKVARNIYDFMKTQKEDDKKQSSNEMTIKNTGAPQNTESQIKTTPEENSQDNNEEESDNDTQSKVKSFGSDETIEEMMDRLESQMYEDEDDDDMDVKTEESFSRNQKKLLSKDTWSTITPPECNWEDYITYNDEFLLDMTYGRTQLKDKTYYNWDNAEGEKTELALTTWDRDFNEYKLSSKKEVNYLVKEFEMKKSASAYARATTSKTGILDTTKLHTYKYNDDIFRKVTTFADGKNHGLMMFVDWSGSMHNEIVPTIKQLFNIVQFCKKVSIPFEVYSFVENRFSSTYSAGKHFSKCSDKNGTIAVNDCFHLVQLFNSNSKSKLDVQMKAVWTLTKMTYENFIHQIEGLGKYEMGGTPLNETIFAATYLYKKFCKKSKIEKVNTVFLTDGESNYLTANKTRKEDDNEWVSRSHVGGYGKAVNFLDPKSGYQQHKLIDTLGAYDSWSSRSLDVTSKLLQYYRWITNSNVVGYRLCNEKPTSIARASSTDRDQFNKTWKKDGFVVEKGLGYNELYVIKMGKGFKEVEEMNANSASTNSKLRNEFKKHIKSKGFHKILLSKFVDQIA